MNTYNINLNNSAAQDNYIKREFEDYFRRHRDALSLNTTFDLDITPVTVGSAGDFMTALIKSDDPRIVKQREIIQAAKKNQTQLTLGSTSINTVDNANLTEEAKKLGIRLAASQNAPFVFIGEQHYNGMATNSYLYNFLKSYINQNQINGKNQKIIIVDETSMSWEENRAYREWNNMSATRRRQNALGDLYAQRWGAKKCC